jgi:hypothetical protein
MPSKRCITRPEGMQRSEMTVLPFYVQPDLGLDVVIAIRRVQAGQRVTGDGLGQLAAQEAARPR